MKYPGKICAALILLTALPLWSQEAPPAQFAPTVTGQDNAQEQPQNQNDDMMLTPPVVSGQTYPTEMDSQERSNYLRAGMSFSSAYGNNAVTTANGKPANEMSYSVAPTLALDETTS